MKLNPEAMTIMGDPLFQAVWVVRGGNEADYRRVQQDYDLQVHFFQWAYARYEILITAQMRGVVFDRDLSRSVPAKVRQWAVSDLHTDGLIEMAPSETTYGWRLTEAGRNRFTDGSGDFALGLLHSLASSLPPGQIETLMERQAEQKAAGYRNRIGEGPLPQRLERLVELRRREGFVAELLADPETPAAWIMSEFHCSVMRIAEEFPMVCDQELQLIRRT